ncbi:HD domain-containing protein (plasmid) [Pontibacillus sp. ALD_SL1]|uniref:HD-GYP domain-containing protein n=1 Tax=Pontibacillus sp. ALD_SL1 TaxID=2777185 RepID=UPI001A9579E6|nr:HD domain-containing phosphohydrolase [Pontibacillus sp. ALD_SL1]QST02904.1 HD domain-containing protein [Pontibacillus sp. ALD_SL1]
MKNVTQTLMGLLQDRETKEHVTRIEAHIKCLLACHNKRFQLVVSKREMELISTASALHDIGKLAVPLSLFSKKGPLTEMERIIMKTHPMTGLYILDQLKEAGWMRLRPQEERIVKNIVLYHHEKWDGSGYPNGLAGEEIPFEARVVSIMDVYDALLSERSYKRPWPKKEAISYIQSEKGKSFDPDLVDTFSALFEENVAA